MKLSQLGSAGIVLLGIWLFVHALLAGISGVETFIGLNAKSGDWGNWWFGLATWSFVVLVAGVLPAAWLISSRAALVRRWFDADAEGGLRVDTPGLLRVGLVLLGVSFLVAGVLSVIMIGSAGSMLWLDTNPDRYVQHAVNLVSWTLHSAVQVVVGVLLVRRAEALAKRWTSPATS